MKHTKEEILEKLNINEDVIAIIPYGSRIYGTFDSLSDYDYIIVTKGSVLNINRGDKTNAISSSDFMIQGTLYSRSGFNHAINSYDMIAMECMALDKSDYVYITPFYEKFILDKARKFDIKEMVKNVIQKASSSRHIADQQAQTGYMDRAKRGMFHALRILTFGLQLKEHGKIVDFGACNEMYYRFKSIDPDEFDTRDYYDEFKSLMDKLKDDE